MKQNRLSKSVLERLPIYLHYLYSLQMNENDTISSASIARALQLGEVQVRKDLSLVCGTGKPKIGYVKKDLMNHLEEALSCHNETKAVVVGVGNLGKTLLSYSHFNEYGLVLVAGFDNDPSKIGELSNGKKVYSIEELKKYCQEENIKIGVITVPEKEAQKVCDLLVEAGIIAIWNFTPGRLTLPSYIRVRNENMAASLAVLSASIK